jgi:hypothetical protein
MPALLLARRLGFCWELLGPWKEIRLNFYQEVIMKKVSTLISLLVCIVLVSTPALAGGFKKSIGQTVYAPANHNCYFIFGDPCTLSINSRLVIRNVENHAITIDEINFHDPDGEFVVGLLEEPLVLQSSASATFAMPSAYPYWDVLTEGRPSYIVRWTAERRVHPPIITSSHAVINRAPVQSAHPIRIEALTATPGTVIKEDWWDRW